MRMVDKITEKLQNSLNIQHLHVMDESDKHIGHAGHDGQGESHFRIYIVSSDLDDMSRIDRHRKIHEILGGDIIGCIHALSLIFQSYEKK